MTHTPRVFAMTAALACVLPILGCGDDPNTGPGSPSNPSGVNRPPIAQFFTNPQSNGGRIQGDAPLKVTFNMCGSTDPDPGDDLRYEYWWRGRTAEPDAIGACRLEHTYGGGGVCETAINCVWDRQPGDTHRVCREYRVCRN